MPQSARKLRAIAECSKGEIETLLWEVKKKIEGDENNKNGLLYSNVNPSITSCFIWQFCLRLFKLFLRPFQVFINFF